jgi:UPF0755 protein
MHLLGYLPFIYEALYLHFIRRVRVYVVGAVLLFVVLPVSILCLPTYGFPHGILVTVEEDASFGETAQMLEDNHIVGSATLLKILGRVTGSDRGVRAGRYVFDSPIGVAEVLYRLTHGITGVKAVRVTFPEGITVREMGEILVSAIPSFDSERFVREAKPYEGYLFPDTYDIFVDATPEEIITRMRARFDAVWSSLENPRDVISGESMERVVTMASILEKETKVGGDRAIVSGILWKRVSIGMALQVDAVFGYIHDTDTYHPSLDDLEVNSPYNTYRNPDLPPGPIGNPGVDALRAALSPVSSKYLYYLTGKDGTVHYAETFEGHKKNRELYLR